MSNMIASLDICRALFINALYINYTHTHTYIYLYMYVVVFGVYTVCEYHLTIFRFNGANTTGMVEMVDENASKYGTLGVRIRYHNY